MQLKYRDDITWRDMPRIERPFFARSKLSADLSGPHPRISRFAFKNPLSEAYKRNSRDVDPVALKGLYQKIAIGHVMLVLTHKDDVFSPAFTWKEDLNHKDKGQWQLSQEVSSEAEFSYQLLLETVKKPGNRGSVKKAESDPWFPGANWPDTGRAAVNTVIDNTNAVTNSRVQQARAENSHYPGIAEKGSANPYEIEKVQYTEEPYGEFGGVVAGVLLGTVGSKKLPKSLFGSGDIPKKFSNKFPSHEIGIPKTIPLDKLKDVNGKFNYVVKEDGKLIVGREFNTPGGGHIDLAGGDNVISAGQVKVVNGEIKYIDNASGHYEPTGDGAQTAASRAFKQLGFDVDNKFIEKQWVSDPKLKNGGAWRPLKND